VKRLRGKRGRRKARRTDHATEHDVTATSAKLRKGVADATTENVRATCESSETEGTNSA